ncbi:MAG: transcription termination factor NusA [Candidatus Levybacteria bacterium RIFCSPHIGHO2_01_FULL_36_15]|nr:MAG: transcription termination factor NusA [Candidatus Levybacteria bacterium RIFCSPHIGHO2_01_FULL_36_15]
MPVVQRSEFSLALNQIASERGVDPSIVIDTIKGAILAAYRKDHPGIEIEEYSVDLDKNTGETKILHKEEDVTPPGFGRIAAQTAKQVLLQKIREKEKDAIFEEYSKIVGNVVNGMILRFAGPNIIMDIGKAEAIMPSSQKIPSESYFLNKKIPVYIVEINEEKKDREIIVSRTHSGLLEGLLKKEVPEVAARSVVVKKVVREPGSRAKIAVYSEQSGVDPVGSCVGQKGVRIQAVIEALDGLEKIDVIQYSSDPAKFIANALSPAKDLKVSVNEEEKIAKVTAPKEELPLIIGREGQNVRLASKLAGYNIEVEGIEEAVISYTCSLCSMKFESQEELEKHFKEKHEKEEKKSKREKKK